MQVRLQFRLSEEVLLEGAQLDGTLPETQRAALLAQHYLAGTVWLEHEGQPAIEVLDDLEQLVPRLCIWARPTLAKGEAVTVEMTISPQRLTLTPAGAEIKATTTWGVEALLPAAACIDELRRCGHQYVAFLDRNLGAEPAWAEKVEDLKLALRGLGEASPMAGEPDPPDAHAVSEDVMRQIMAEQAQEP